MIALIFKKEKKQQRNVDIRTHKSKWIEKLKTKKEFNGGRNLIKSNFFISSSRKGQKNCFSLH